MLLFPHAKINLGLNVLRKRADGYHDIESVLVPIPLHDVLEAIIDPTLKKNDIVFTRTGIPVPGDPDQDLCMKAARLIQRERELPGIRIHLHKVIPIGAGLGGGSSDGAHTLLLLDHLLNLGITPAELHDIASSLGSDCPFFLAERPQWITGRGELLQPITLELRGWWLMLVHPPVHVSTAEVYAHSTPAPARADLLQAITTTTPDRWNGLVVNVMEEYVLTTCPAVAEAKDRIAKSGANYAAMSGSGSSVFGLFRTRPGLPALPPGHRAWVLPL